VGWTQGQPFYNATHWFYHRGQFNGKEVER
jgi:hypothetical protein